MNFRKRLLCLSVATGILFASAGCFAGAPTSPPAKIPYKQTAASSDMDFGRVASALIIAALAFGGYLYFMRRRLGPMSTIMSKQKHLKILEAQRLNPRAMLYVVEFAGSRYMLAQSEQGITCLAHAPTPNADMPEAQE